MTDEVDDYVKRCLGRFDKVGGKKLFGPLTDKQAKAAHIRAVRRYNEFLQFAAKVHAELDRQKGKA